MCAVSAVVDLKTAAAIDERVKAREQSIRETIESYGRYIETQRAKLAEVEQQVVRFFALKARLEAAGFSPEAAYWSEHLELTVSEDQLKDVYALVGRLDGERKSVDLVNARRKLVRVTMPAVEFPFLTVSYETKLPDGAPCRIEKVKTKARVEARLVCTA